MHVFTGSCCSAEMINGTSRLLLRKETSLLMRNLEVGVETQMKNVIISSRMWLGLALAVILGAITQTLPSSLAVDKGPVAAGPTIANLVTTHSRASLRPEIPFQIDSDRIFVRQDCNHLLDAAHVIDQRPERILSIQRRVRN